MRRVLWIIAAAAMMVGIYGFWARFAHGHVLAGHNSFTPFGLWVAVYIYFIGLSVGSFQVFVLAHGFGVKKMVPLGKISLFTALVCLAAGIMSIWVDLGHMVRVWRTLLNPNFGSVMVWNVWLYNAFGLILLSGIYYALKGGQGSERKLKTLALIGLPLGLACGGGAGALLVLAVVGTKPFWHSGLLPVMSIFSALASGGALITLVAAYLWPNRDEKHEQVISLLGRIVLGWVSIDLLMVFAEYLVTYKTALPAERISVDALLSGTHAVTFWLGQVIIAYLIPIVLLAGQRLSVSRVGTACLLMVFGFLVVRYLMVIPGQEMPAFTALPAAYSDTRLKMGYFPTFSEWALTIGIAGMSLAIYLTGLSKLNLLPKDNLIAE